jgi:hypothetical protein
MSSAVAHLKPNVVIEKLLTNGFNPVIPFNMDRTYTTPQNEKIYNLELSSKDRIQVALEPFYSTGGLFTEKVDLDGKVKYDTVMLAQLGNPDDATDGYNLVNKELVKLNPIMEPIIKDFITKNAAAMGIPNPVKYFEKTKYNPAVHEHGKKEGHYYLSAKINNLDPFKKENKGNPAYKEASFTNRVTWKTLFKRKGKAYKEVESLGVKALNEVIPPGCKYTNAVVTIDTIYKSDKNWGYKARVEVIQYDPEDIKKTENNAYLIDDEEEDVKPNIKQINIIDDDDEEEEEASIPQGDPNDE